MTPEEIIIYSAASIVMILIVSVYIIKLRRETKKSHKKISHAIDYGLHEPVSLYPVVDTNRCIRSGACIKACPEHDVLGIQNGKATIINASRCIGHGACFRSCPVEAISLWIGTEKRGVDLPHVNPNFETNIPGIYIAGELGGMGLIRNAVTQGREAVENIAAYLKADTTADYDLVIVGAGPAGISASLAAKKANLKAIVFEQESLGGTIATFPRTKIVSTHPVILPLYGKTTFRETTKKELLTLWKKLIHDHNLEVRENARVTEIQQKEGGFIIQLASGESYKTKSVLLAIGRRGTPRKLDIPGETSEKVAYRLIEPENIENKKIVVVGGGDSAVESALLLANKNKVTLSYRGENFSRLKPRNLELIQSAIDSELLTVLFNTNLKEIAEHHVLYSDKNSDAIHSIENDFVYIFAGGELPTQFLNKTGIITNTKRGEVILGHKKS